MWDGGVRDVGWRGERWGDGGVRDGGWRGERWGMEG